MTRPAGLRGALAALAVGGLAAGTLVIPAVGAAAAVVPVTPVPALVETAPVGHSGDAADDPAIWVDPADPSRSLVIGNDKGGALETYDLDGAVVQRISGTGEWGNVDVRQGVTVAGITADVVVYYHVGVQFAQVDLVTRQLIPITQGVGISVPGEGLCLYHPASGELYVYVVGRDGTVRQFLVGGNNGLLTGQLVRTFFVGSEAEGCQVDDTTGALYVSEEDVALWRYDAAPTAGTTRTVVDRVVASGGRLAPDLEGITSVRRADGTGVLIVSAQNVADRPDSYFAVYDLDTNAYIRSFRVVNGSAADDCDGTDGIAATAVSVSSLFPNGLFVCQDNNNDSPGSAGNQNFKYADMQAALTPADGTPPQAAIQVSCAGLTCAFDGSGSTDGDGTITSYAWDFGDQGTDSQAQATHTYPSGGTYLVQLTVTDDDGLSSTATRQVVLGGATGPASFVAAASTQGNAASGRVVVPASVRSGDTMLLFTSTSSPVTSPPAGWTAAATRDSGPLTTTLWTRQALLSDAGNNVTAGFALGKYTFTLVAYRGLDPAAPVAALASLAAGSGTSRTTPTVASPVAGWVVSYWADRSSSTTSWTGPATGERRVAVYGTGGGRVTSLLADSAGDVPAGLVGGLAAATDQAGSRATTWTVALRGTSSPAQSPPTAVIDVGCEALVCHVDGSQSSDPDGQVRGYAWDFGDGTTGAGQTTSHTYAQPGHYTITLTVTDEDGLTGTTTRAVEVADAPPPGPAAPVARPLVSCLQLSCQADGSRSSASDGEITSYAWDFGDGQSGTGSTATHTYTRAGTYVVTLTVTDDDGLTGAATTTVSPAETTGTPVTMGDNSLGQLGDGTSVTGRPSPGAVTGLSDVVQLDGGREHVIALTSDGRVFTWGSNGMGQLGLGLGTGAVLNVPTQVTGLPPVTAVTTGHYHSLALASDGRVWAWGNNASGQLGDGTRTQRTSPVQVQGLTDVVSIAAGRDMSYAIRSDGTLWAWGLNDEGELGNGTTTTSTGPVQVGTPPGVSQVAAGRDHGLAILEDGTVWAWGANEYGQLGDGTTTNRSTPVQIAAGWRAVAAGAQHSYSIRADGQVMAWGRNYRHELGDGSTADELRPVSVPGVTNATAIGSGRDHGLAVIADGSVMAWGYNAGGQLGDGTTTDAATAFTVPGVSGATDVGGGALYSVILRSGTVPPPPVNHPPTAVAGVSCQQLTCTVDGSGSSDPDGPLASYLWTFGDGTSPVSGATASHTYAAPGTYSITLTVTDQGGLTSADTRPVTVAGPPPAAGSITFLAATGATANTTRASTTVPAGISSGDGLLALLSVSLTAPTVTAPPGWTLVGQANTSSIRTMVYRRTATAGDAGSTVQFTLSAQAKTVLQVAAYRGVASGSFAAVTFQTAPGAGTVRSAPAATVATAGSWVANYWVDRSSTNHTWASPGGTVVRNTAYGTGGGEVSALLADSGAAVPTGTYASRSATASASGGQAIAATLVLSP